MTSPVQSRRERVRAETTTEIKDRAWSLMADAGVDALSLRGVARQMGMAPSALYRYFASRDDLLTALIVDGFDSLTATLRAAYDAANRGPDQGGGHETFRLVAVAYRRWALDHPTEYGLIFSSSIPGYAGNDLTAAATMRSSDVLLDIMEDMVREGAIDLEAIVPGLSIDLQQRLEAWSPHGGHNLPTPALAAAMWCYMSLHGAINLEVNGHFPPPLMGSEDLFVSALQSVVQRIAP